MKYLLDTIDKQEILECIRTMPVSGVTSNPSIIKKHGKVDFFPYFSELSALLGARRTLHIQVTAPDAEGMLREAEAITEKVGPGTYIKVPVNEPGLEAIGCMKKLGMQGSTQRPRPLWPWKPARTFWPCTGTAWSRWISTPSAPLPRQPK